MYNYCTLFNSHYLTRGLAMYQTLAAHSDDFHLYVFAFDDKSFTLLKKLDYKNMTVISLSEFEDEALLSVKPSRSVAEYCWTCTPSVIKYVIDHFQLESCTYLDADLYFYSNPAILIDEMGDASVLITEHRYTPEYDQSITSGIYCVQFMTFKNDELGLTALNWWREACIEWCYARFEEGKFGDQKYLDDWLTRFEGVHVLQNVGGAVAPWNVQQYNLEDNSFKLVFYHFHDFKFFEKGQVALGNYRLDDIVLEKLYKPYIRHLLQIAEDLKEYGESSCYHGINKKTFHWKDPVRFVKRKWKGTYNIFDLHKLIGE